MNKRLKDLEEQEWLKLAQQANWSAAALATKCGISVRTLHRHFLKQTGKNTKAWLAEQRQHHALELLRAGSAVKETAFCVGYKQSTNFTRKFKDGSGICPSQVQQTFSSQIANVRK